MYDPDVGGGLSIYQFRELEKGGPTTISLGICRFAYGSSEYLDPVAQISVTYH